MDTTGNSPFYSHENPFQGSIFKENLTLSQLRPITKDQAPPVKASWFSSLSLSSLLYSGPKSTNYSGVVAAFDRESVFQKMNLNLIAPHELISYFQRFIASDEAVSLEFKACMEKFSLLLENLNKINQLTNEDQKEKEKQLVFDSAVKDLAELKIGEFRLIPVNGKPNDQLFYLISKDSDKSMTIKIIGRGASMIDLSDVEEVAVKGKVKIPSVIIYKDIPLMDEKGIRNLLNCSELESINFKIKSLQAYLKPFQKFLTPINQSSPLSTKTDHFFKSFWSGVKIANDPMNNNHKAINERFHLKISLSSLFEMFDHHKNDLKVGSEEFREIETLFRATSEEVVKTYKKGFINQQDLKDVVAELNFVQNAMEKAAKTELPSLGSINYLDMSIYTSSTVSNLKLNVPKPVNLQTKPSVAVNEASLAIPVPKHTGEMPALLQELVKPIQDIASLNQSFAGLIKNPSKEKIIETILKLEFSPLKAKNIDHAYLKTDYERDQTSLWNHLSKDEAVALMQQFNQLSNFIVSAVKKEPYPSLDYLEALIKMSAIVLYLGNQHFTFAENSEYRTLSGASTSSLSHLFAGKVNEIYTNKVDAVSSDKFYRKGYRLNSLNLKTRAEINFPFVLSVEPDKKVTAKESLENEKYFREQLKYIDQVSPFFADSSFFLPSNTKKWMRPLKHPMLVAAYYNMSFGISEEKKNDNYQLAAEMRKFLAGKVTGSIVGPSGIQFHGVSAAQQEMAKEKATNIILQEGGIKTQEAMVDDPETVAKILIQKLSDAIEDEALDTADDLKSTLNLSKDEMTGLLLLLRNEDPQTEILAFIEKYPALMKEPEVRNYLDMLFFDYPLLHTLKDRKGFKEALPSILNDKIKELELKSLENPKLIDQLVFFVDWSNRLEDLYKEIGYETKGFNPENNQVISALIKKAEVEPHLKFYLHGCLTIELQQLLKKEKLAGDDINQILIDYSLRQNAFSDPLNQDPAANFFLETHYKALIDKLKDQQLKPDSYEYVLDSLCEKNKITVDKSAWTGNFPVFQKSNYQINFATGNISQLSTNEIVGLTLPNNVVFDPEFSKTFENLDITTLKITTYELDSGNKVYLFKDKHGLDCRIEGKGNEYSYYKTFPAFPNVKLQAIPLERLQPKIEKPNQASWRLTNALFVLKYGFGDPTPPKLPLILDRGLYIDPANPLVGYSFNDKGEALFKVDLQTSKVWGLKIKNITDLRDPKLSNIAWEVKSGEDIDHPVIQKLSSFEHLAQILVWGQKGHIEKIELPRFGLKFKLEGDQLICLNPAYKGYSIDLNASDADKQGIPFSLLLKAEDRNLPDKLIAPETDNFSMNIELQLSKNRGIAWMISLVQTLRKGVDSKIQFENVAKDKELPLIVMEIRPNTSELMCPKDKRVHHFIELTKQMFLLSKFESASEMIKLMNIQKSDLTTSNKRQIAQFLNKTYNSGSFEACVKLKLLKRLQKIAGTDPKHSKFVKGVEELILQLFPIYLAQGEKIPESLALTKLDFVQIAKLFKNNDTSYYEKHLLPYFLDKGEPFDFPVKLKSSDKPHKSSQREDLLEKEVELVKKLDVEVESMTIEELEKLVNPSKKIDLNEMRASFKYIPDAPELLFSKEILADYFKEEQIDLPAFKLPDVEKEAPSAEKIAVKNLRKNLENFRREPQFDYQLTNDPEKLKEIIKKQEFRIFTLKAQKLDVKNKIDHLLKTSSDPLEQAAIYGKIKIMANFKELMLAMIQNNLEGLKEKGRLPTDLDTANLKQLLINYFDAEVKLNLSENCLQRTIELEKLNGWLEADAWKTESTTLYQLLSANRRYDINKNPEFLAFEALKSLTFRSLGAGTHQLDLLLAILRNPAGITLAKTGAGKSAILNVMRALMMPNGKNLISLRVLPALYNQTLDLLKSLQHDFKVFVYPLRFDLKMSLIKKETILDQGNKPQIVQTSIFKEYYHKMLQTIQEKGCIVSDYKSYPLMEAKLWKLTREFKAMQSQGIEIPDIELEHWTSLKKIMILQGSLENALMDEFDQPNRPINRIQLQMEKPKLPAAFLAEDSMKIYKLLMQEKHLMLKENLQNEVDSDTRQLTIVNVAKKIAQDFISGDVTEKDVLDYILGKSEHILSKISDWPLEKKDELVFFKDQFYTFIPLALSYRGKSRYERSEDGKRILPCVMGEAHDAKFGSILVEINYMIQDYLQTGIKEAEFKEWIDNLVKELSKGHEGAKKRFETIFPGKSLENLKDYKIKKLAREVNADLKNENPEKIWYFLSLRLKNMTVSGSVISMDPQNIVSQSRAVSGVSATLGSADALHSQFQIDKESADKIQAEMVYRLVNRLDNHYVLDEYDPKNPEEIITKNAKGKNISALIDGAGAFVEYDSKKVAKLMESDRLERVGFPKKDGSLDFVGNPHADINKRGFYYAQAYTRGLDVKFPEDATGILTVDDQGNLENLNQHEGRMRQNGQKIVMTRSSLKPHLKTAADVVVAKAAFGGNKQAEDLFSAKKQEMDNLLRADVRNNFLTENDFDKSLDIFTQFEDFFVTPAVSDYQAPGSYFAAHHRIRKADKNPLDVLENKKAKLIEKCHKNGLHDTIDKLDKISYPQEIVEMMPEAVFGLEDNLDMDVEIELEEELELETELELEAEEELEFELEKEKSPGVEIPFYLPRLETNIVYSVQKQINPAYDNRINFTESFLQLSRTDPLHKRKPFDSKMYDIGAVRFKVDMERSKDPMSYGYLPVVKSALIGDVLDEKDLAWLSNSEFIYDIRNGKVTAFDPKISHYGVSTLEVLKTPEFKLITAQIKFLNGQVEGYSAEEVVELKKWLKGSGKEAMKQHFEKQVLQYSPEILEKYPHSQLWNIFRQ
jgi:hypothetical protein